MAYDTDKLADGRQQRIAIAMRAAGFCEEMVELFERTGVLAGWRYDYLLMAWVYELACFRCVTPWGVQTAVPNHALRNSVLQHVWFTNEERVIAEASCSEFGSRCPHFAAWQQGRIVLTVSSATGPDMPLPPKMGSAVLIDAEGMHGASLSG